MHSNVVTVVETLLCQSKLFQDRLRLACQWKCHAIDQWAESDVPRIDRGIEKGPCGLVIDKCTAFLGMTLEEGKYVSNAVEYVAILELILSEFEARS